jgi:hypothetical protein
MPSLFRHIHTVNNAPNLSAVKLEQGRALVLTPPIADRVLEILISFPWQ